MENIIFCEILCALVLITLILYRMVKTMYNVGNVLIEYQQKLSKQINRINTNNIQLSTDDCIVISNIIATLTRIEEEKFMSYEQEIKLLNKILYNGQRD